MNSFSYASRATGATDGCTYVS